MENDELAYDFCFVVPFPLVYKKKTGPAGDKTASGHCIKKKKTFSHRSRKPLNPCPTHTQRHHSPCENNHGRGQTLDLCFGVGTDEGIFFNLSLKMCSHGEPN